MGLQSGSVSLCRYRLLGDASRAKLGELNDLLSPYMSEPLKIGGVHKEELVGWVRPVGLDDVELPPDTPWDLSHCQADDGFVLRMRIERRKVPAQLLQLVYKQRFFSTASAGGKPPGPKERKELRETLHHDLMGRALPALVHVDAYWRDRQGELTLFSTGKAVRRLFETLFQKTFATPLGQNLMRIDPPLMGLSRDEFAEVGTPGVASELLGRLSLTTPVAFAERVYP